MAGHLKSGSALPQKFKKAERLSSKKIIDELFSKGSSFVFYPFKIFYLIHSSYAPVKTQVLIAVSKKHFKRSVDRNRIKRLMRESYRQHKQCIISNNIAADKSLCIAILYTANSLPEFNTINLKMNEALLQITNRIQ